jgi:hypothetical protein
MKPTAILRSILFWHIRSNYSFYFQTYFLLYWSVIMIIEHISSRSIFQERFNLNSSMLIQHGIFMCYFTIQIYLQATPDYLIMQI